MAIDVELARRLWSVDAYQRMVDTGILTDRAAFPDLAIPVVQIVG